MLLNALLSYSHEFATLLRPFPTSNYKQLPTGPDLLQGIYFRTLYVTYIYIISL